MINPDGTDGEMSFEVEMSCMACGRGIRSWFHGQGAICSDCSEKGIARDNLHTFIWHRYKNQKSIAKTVFTKPENEVS